MQRSNGGVGLSINRNNVGLPINRSNGGIGLSFNRSGGSDFITRSNGGVAMSTIRSGYGSGEETRQPEVTTVHQELVKGIW